MSQENAQKLAEESADAEEQTGLDDSAEMEQEADSDPDTEDDQAASEPDIDADPDTGDDEAEEEEEEELTLSIGDEPAEPDEHAQAPDWVRELRKAQRETARENKELKERLKSLENPAPAKKALGPKPTLADHDYDPDEFEAALEKWHDQKRQAEAEQAQRAAAEKEAATAWEQKLTSYAEAKAALKFKDVEEAEATVLENLNETQQGIILQGADNPALVVYALGTNPKRAKELSKTTDPVKFAFAVAKLEKDLKVSKRKSPPPPERKVSGTGPNSGAVDSVLEKLRNEAAKTGNYTKVAEYKRKKRNASA